MEGLVRISCVVPETFVSNARKNAQEIIKYISACQREKAHIVLFPELCVTGYSCGDLFLTSSLLKASNEALLEIAKATSKTKGVYIVGAPLVIDGMLFDCAIVISCGKVCGIVPKNNISKNQSRWFCSSRNLENKETHILSAYFDKNIPVVTDGIFSINNTAFCIEIGEDAQSPVSNSSYLTLCGAHIVLNPTAIEQSFTKNEKIVSFAKQKSENLKCTYVLCSAGCSESTTDFVYSGKSAVFELGDMLCHNTNVCDSDYSIFADTDIVKIENVRLKDNVFASNVQDYVNLVQRVEIDTNDMFDCDGANINVSKTPFEDGVCEEMLYDAFCIAAKGLSKRLKVTGAKAVIGVSGGLDSTLALLVCVKAVKDLGRDIKDVVGVTMPCFGTSDRTYNNATSLMEKLGIEVKNIPIKDAVRVHFDNIGHSEEVHDLTYENAQARERTQVLMDIAGMVGGLVVGTGDLSELCLGWCTYNADHMSMYGVNSSIPKTLIPKILGAVKNKGEFEGCEDIIEDIMSTPISPELLPPDENGKINQKTEDLVGPYVLHDFFIYYYLKYGFDKERISFYAEKAFADTFDSEFIEKWLCKFFSRFMTQQYKRSCQSDGVKVCDFGISPRGDLVMPSDADISK